MLILDFHHFSFSPSAIKCLKRMRRVCYWKSPSEADDYLNAQHVLGFMSCIEYVAEYVQNSSRKELYAKWWYFAEQIEEVGMVLTWTRLPPLSTRLQTILDESHSKEPITPISNEEQSGESPPPLSLDSCATYSLSDILGCAQNSTNLTDKIKKFVVVNRSMLHRPQ